MSVILENPLDSERFLRRGSAPCIRYGSSAFAPPTSPRCNLRRDTLPSGFALNSIACSSPRSQQRSLQPRLVEPLLSFAPKLGSSSSNSVAVKPSVARQSPRSSQGTGSGAKLAAPASSFPSNHPKQTPRSPPPTSRTAPVVQPKAPEPDRCKHEQRIVPVVQAKAPEPDRCKRDDERLASDARSIFANSASPRSSLTSFGCNDKAPLARIMQRRRTTDCSHSAAALSPVRAPCQPTSPKSTSPSRACQAPTSKIRTASPVLVSKRRASSDETCGSVSTCYHEGSSKSSSGADDASQKETPVSSARLTEFSILRRQNPELVVDVQVDDDWIDPSRPSLKPLIFEVLGVSPHAVMQRMEKTHGGLNQGLWSVRDSSHQFVLKMVTCTRFMGLPTEAEAFVALSRRAPKVADDASISFPLKIFHCRCSDGQMKDLIAMRRVDGTCFADLVMSRLSSRRTWELGRELKAFGKFLAEFHERHKMQHADLTLANIIYNERSRQFYLIDVAEMGNPRIKETDAEHLVTGLRTMTKRHGTRAFEDCKKSFEDGFKEATEK